MFKNMAKELPYFQFEPAEYLTGDISFCSLATQGLFTNLCSYYWQRSCKLTQEQFLRRINAPKEFQELVDENVIQLDENGIIIKFLDIQLENATKQSKTNSINGSKGGRPKKEKQIKTEIKPKLNPNESETKGIREDKIKEDNINNIYDRFVAEVKIHGFDSQIESLYMRLKLKHGNLTPLLKDFQCHLIEKLKDPDFVMHKTTNEYFTNFKNWLNVQDRIKKLDKYR